MHRKITVFRRIGECTVFSMTRYYMAGKNKLNITASVSKSAAATTLCTIFSIKTVC